MTTKIVNKKYMEQLSIFVPFVILWRHRLLIFQVTKNDLRAKYVGSVLGFFWLILYPLVFLSMYAIVYIVILKVRFALFGSNEYVALIFCGLIPFLGFAEALSLGVPSVVSNSTLIKNTLFPIELIPVKSIFVAQGTQVVGTIALLITIGFLGRLTVWVFLLPVVWLLQIIFMIGLIWILSSLNVFIRDIQTLLGPAVLMLMMITPIAYPVEMVPAGLRPFLGLNPLYYIVAAYQDILMNGQFPRGIVFWVLIFISFTSFYCGHWFFKRLKGVFADNV